MDIKAKIDEIVEKIKKKKTENPRKRKNSKRPTHLEYSFS